MLFSMPERLLGVARIINYFEAYVNFLGRMAEAIFPTKLGKYLKNYNRVSFDRISIPLIRRIYPQLIASKIVSVQPMTAPSSLSYYLRFKYSSNKGTEKAEEPS